MTVSFSQWRHTDEPRSLNKHHPTPTPTTRASISFHCGNAVAQTSMISHLLDLKEEAVRGLQLGLRQIYYKFHLAVRQGFRHGRRHHGMALLLHCRARALAPTWRGSLAHRRGFVALRCHVSIALTKLIVDWLSVC